MVDRRPRGETGADSMRHAAGAADEPIAIVGVGCRFPGGASSPEGLWDVVAEGRDVSSGFPVDRGWEAWLEGEGRDSLPSRGGFLPEAAGFDPGLFGVSPREALAMDPQQRLLLEVSWEALERAGIDPSSLRGSETGVFAGLTSGDYWALLQRTTEDVEAYLVTGASGSAASGRVAYALGLEGPAVTVDTSASSSLVAMHLASRSLRAGECGLALAGGVTVMATPTWFRGFAQLGGLAPDGRCKAFAGAADGTGWSEGVGVVVLEALSEAQRNGHRVWGVIRGSAVNQDGASNGLTAPNGLAQQRVIRRALAEAGLSPGEVDAVEAHGTGTVLGDPIEAEAILATYGQGRDEGAAPLWLGSVKSNIGHPQAAAGVAGVIKVLMAMRHGVLPRTLHVDEPTPHVDWSTGRVELLSESREWKGADRPRRAGVSSFGISGTNAHLILEQAPGQPAEIALADRSERPEGPQGADHPRATEGPEAPDAVPLVVSGASAEALAAQAGRLAEHLRTHDEAGLGDVGRALVAGRAALAHRAVVVAADRPAALQGLEALAGGEPAANVVSGRAADAGGVVYVFPGQGSQWAGMAAGLMERFPVFAEAMQACEAALAPHVDWSLVEVSCGRSKEWLERVDVVQPALFAMMVSLAALWESFGVAPAAVAGHSQGEIAAAHVAGGLSLEDAERVVVAIVNGPNSVTVSGDPEALDEFVAMCEAERIRAKRVAVDYASHSPQVEAIRDQLLEALAGIEPRPSRVPFCSTLSGEVLDTGALDAEYWYRNLREPGRFETAVRALAAEGHGLFVEVSAHPVLLPPVQDTLDELDRSAVAIGTLRRGEGPERMVTALADAWTHGAPIDWSPLFPGQAQPVELPTYSFQHNRFWPSVAPVITDPTASLLRVEWEPLVTSAPTTGGRWAVAGADTLGLVATLTAAGVAAEQHDDLASLAGTNPMPDLVVCCVGDATDADEVEAPDVPGLASARSLDVLGCVQEWLADERFAGSRLVVTTQGGVFVGSEPHGEHVVGLAHAPVWGLVRSAQLENPGRFVLVDVDEAAESRTALPAAVGCGEPEVAVRAGRPWVRRLVRVRSSEPPDGRPSEFDPDGTVLVTGGTGTLGGLVARRLVEGHGVRSLVLTSRRGIEAPGARELTAELETLGAEVAVAACDVADRGALSNVLADVPERRPLRGVVHTAGAIDDAAVWSLRPQQFQTVWGPKATGAWNLHELTQDLDLSAFVVFSSTSGLLGAAGQANYAAASVFLDALMEERHAEGLPAVSVAWGLWAEASGLTGHLDDTDLARMRRSGVVPLSTGEGLDLFDRAVHHPPVVAAVDLDLSAVRDAAPFPQLWHRLVGSTAPLPGAEPDAETPGLPARVAGLSVSERRRALVDVVRAEAAAVLGHAGPEAVETDRALKELGFDSLTAVELRNRLAALSGLRLPTTLVFDHPTVALLSQELDARLEPPEASPSEEALGHLAELEAVLSSAIPDESVAGDLRAGLQRALARLTANGDKGSERIEDELRSADAEEVLEFIDTELGGVG